VVNGLNAASTGKNIEGVARARFLSKPNVIVLFLEDQVEFVKGGKHQKHAVEAPAAKSATTKG